MGVLDGKVALVTGGGRGIGRGIALAFASEGADVAVLELDAGNCAAVANEICERGARGLAITGDVRRKADCLAAVERTVSELGSPTILVNNAIATNGRETPLLEHTDEEMISSWESGVLATFWLMQACAPIMSAQGGGSIINFGSGIGTAGAAGWAAYASTKEGIRGLTRVAAREWGPHGIRANAICPFANSPGMQRYEQEAPDQYQALMRTVPLQRIGDCENDIGALAVFLASEAGSYLTANTFMADGGSGVFR